MVQLSVALLLQHLHHQLLHAGTTYYYVVVTGSCSTATSNTAAVVVNATTAISAQPLATQTVCQNTAATALSVTATGTGTYLPVVQQYN